jgi:hypothetical protein
LIQAWNDSAPLFVVVSRPKTDNFLGSTFLAHWRCMYRRYLLKLVLSILLRFEILTLRRVLKACFISLWGNRGMDIIRFSQTYKSWLLWYRWLNPCFCYFGEKNPELVKGNSVLFDLKMFQKFELSYLPYSEMCM